MRPVSNLYVMFLGGFRQRLMLVAILAFVIYGYFFSGLKIGSDCHPPRYSYSKKYNWSRSDCETWTIYRYGQEPVSTKTTLPSVIRH